MRRAFAAIATVLALAGPATATPNFTTLQPGQFREINQDLQVNIVFVGYEQGTGPRDINEAAFRAGLPQHYRTLDVRPTSYIPGPVFTDEQAFWTGNSFDYTYNLFYADQAFENAYFSYLSSIAIPIYPTVFDDFYNTQTSRSLTIDSNSIIDGTMAEQWLAENGGSIPGVDTTKYTVFLVNWYGKSDFRHHMYTKFGDPDPDTGVDFGFFQLHLMTSFGGTPPDDEQNGLGSLRRVWFFDLSSNPGYGLSNYFQDNDLNPGGGFYTMPPVWEYGNLSAYRRFDDLSGDLAKVTRYVALDFLFTKSPISPPALSPPKMPNSIQVDINTYNLDPSADIRDYMKSPVIVGELGKLRPYNSYSASITDLAVHNRELQIYLCGAGQFIALFIDPTYPFPSCYGNRGDENDLVLTDYFLYHRDHLNQLIEGHADLDVPVLSYSTPDSMLQPGALGFQDDDHYDGTRASFCYTWLSASNRNREGLTHTIIHEVGHYMGISHPHDGYDYEDGRYVEANDFPDFYGWVGDESDSVMSYNHTSHNFSQFDRDNMNRYMTAIYINQANKILPRIFASPMASQVNNALLSSDADASAALTSYASMDYLDAARKAKSAYDKILAAAASIHISIEPAGWPSDYRRHRPHPGVVDPVEGRPLAMIASGLLNRPIVQRP